MTSATVDALVVGGGPAGALSALQLARLGWRTMLVDRGPRHRKKTCGHCLNHRALSMLAEERLLSQVQAIACGCTRFVHVHLVGGSAWKSEFEPGVLVERDRFDQLLIDCAANAGAEVIQPANARFIGSDNEGVVIEINASDDLLRVRTRLLVGADGLGSGVARMTGLSKRSGAGRKYGFAFDVVAPHRQAFNRSTIHLFTGLGGYLGVVNQGGQRLHMAGLVDDQESSIARGPVEFIRQTAALHEPLQSLDLHDIQRDAMHNFTAIGPMPWRPRRVANATTALVGDAAGYVEPFTGEGMSWAIESARVLQRTVQDLASPQWNDVLAENYQRLWLQSIGRRQRYCRAVAFALARPRVCRWLFSLGELLPPVTRRVMRQVVAT